MKRTNKIISLLLSSVMVLAIAPISAFAVEGDGVPTTIDVSEEKFHYIRPENYDPDGIIFTGNNPDAKIHIYVDADITLKDLTACHIDTWSDEKITANINLEGDNVLMGSAGHVFQLGPSDVIINAEEGATLTSTVDGYFFTNSGWGGTFTVNGGDFNITSNAETLEVYLMAAPYTQNGGNITVSAKDTFIIGYDVVLNGGVLNVANRDKYIARDDITVAPGAIFKAISGKGIFENSNKKILVGGPDADEAANLCLFAKTSADGDFVPVSDSSTLRNAQYLEIKVDIHEHSLSGSDVCACGIKKADYSGYYAAIERYNKLTGEYKDVLVEKTKDYIREEIKKIVDEHLGGTGVKNNYTEAEQYILDGIADGVNGICDTLEAGIADGTLIKPDYTAIEAKIAEFEQTYTGEKYAAFISEIKAELDAIKATNPETHADVAAAVAQLEAKIDAVANCTHICHSESWFLNVIWTIANFIHSLLGLSPVCACGQAHY